MVGASPLGGDIDTLCQCAEAGAAAVVMHSLFEEQIKQADPFIAESADLGAAPSAEASDYLPHGEIFSHGPDDYIEKIRQAKRAVDIPIIGSLNGTHQGPWLDYAGHIADAGADALELTVYRVPTDPAEEGAAAEKETLEMVAAVKELVDIPVAVKLSPFYSSLPNFVVKARLHGQQLGLKGKALREQIWQASGCTFDGHCRVCRCKFMSELMAINRWTVYHSSDRGDRVA